MIAAKETPPVIRRFGFMMGSAFLFGGLLSFVPGVVKDGLYLGVFLVNTAHNLLHITSGVVFFIASFLGAKFARLWFQIFGLFYAGMAGWGLYIGVGMICGIIPNNNYDSWGHAGLALIMLSAGFLIRDRPLLGNHSYLQKVG